MFKTGGDEAAKAAPAQDELEKLGPFRLPAMLSTGQVEEFKIFYYGVGGEPYYVLVKGELDDDNVLVRVHSACSFAHVFNSLRCDCKEQLDKSMQQIADEGGVLVYAWGHEGRSVGFKDHFRSYMKQDEGYDTVDSYTALGLPVDDRDYSHCAKILHDLDIKKVRLLTNNPRKIEGLKRHGFEVERVPLTVQLSRFNESQLRVKKEKLGHMYELKELE